MIDWQPIDTAPRDETDVLLWRPPLPPIVAAWFDQPGYRGWRHFEDADDTVRGQPTHWARIQPPDKVRAASLPDWQGPKL